MNIDIKYQPKEYSMYKLAEDITDPSRAAQIRAAIKADGDTIMSKINKKYLKNKIKKMKIYLNAHLTMVYLDSMKSKIMIILLQII